MRAAAGEERWLRRGLFVAGVVVALALAATLTCFVLTIRTRLLEYVEGCMLFEASRLREHLPLYIDPVKGAFEYGPVPTRYLVVYPPLWSSLLSLVPEGSAIVLGRAIGALCWYGPLAWIAWGAHRRGRPLGVLATAFVGGIYTLALYGASTRPDSLAVGLAAIALERSARARRVTPGSALLFALAPWVKPNVLGIAAGAMLLDARRRRSIASLALAALLCTLVAAALHLATGGAWLTHLLLSTGQPVSLAQWTDQVVTRLQFLGLPLAFAAFVGFRSRGEAGVHLALAALGTSLVWTVLSLAKIGSATNYWMEPCVAGAVILAHAPAPELSLRARRVAAVLAPLQALWTGVASIRSSLETIAWSPGHAHVLDEVRGSLRAGEVALSDDAGIELGIDGRLVDEPFQLRHLADQGRFPVALLEEDVRHPAVRAFVTLSDMLERPPREGDPLHDRYDPRLRQVLREELVLTSREAGLYVYRRR